MNKVYLLAPLAALLAFGSFYWKHARAHEVRLAEIARAEVLAREQKKAQRAAEQQRAMEQAGLVIAQRQREREEKERADEAYKQTQHELEQRRNRAADQMRRIRPQLDRLRLELEATQAAIARGEEQKRELQREQMFLADYVRAAESNRDAFYRLLEKLEAVERTRAAGGAPSAPANRRS